MALNIAKGCKDRLIERCEELLPNLKVKNDQYLTNESRVLFLIPDNALPDKGPLKQELHRFLGHYPFVTFSTDMISRYLAEQCDYNSDSDEMSLADIIKISGSDTIATWLVDEFEKLPYLYGLVLQLPKGVSSELRLLDRGFKISDQIELRVANHGFCDEFPRNSDNANMQKRIYPPRGLLEIGKPRTEEWDKEACYLVFKIEGYVDQFGTTAPAVAATNLAKSFFGFLIALGLFKSEYKPLQIAPGASFFVFKQSNERWEIDGRFDGDSRFRDTLRDLSFTQLKSKYDNDDFKRKLILDRISKIQCVLKSGNETNRLILAAKWYFDAFTRQDTALSFLQTVIVLEVLVGERNDSDELGLGALLKNRVAYMIAVSSNERATLLKEIGEIYRLRSKIVHTGKHMFSPEEQILFSKLKEICCRIFQKEIEFLQHEQSE